MARPSVLAPALQSIGISNDSIRRYEKTERSMDAKKLITQQATAEILGKDECILGWPMGLLDGAAFGYLKLVPS
jgi:hypothetical protein